VVALVLPVLLGFAAVVVDGGNLFAQRRTVQNAADAAALAIADQELDAYGAGCDLNLSACQKTLVNYSNRNRGPDGMITADDCARKPTDCYTLETSYIGGRARVKVTIKKHASIFFGGVLRKFGVLPSYNVQASATASTKPTGIPLFMFAMDNTNCTAIQINGPNNDNTVGANEFPGIWSNGGVKVNSPGNTTDLLVLNRLVNPNPCLVPDPTKLSGPAPGYGPVPVSYVAERPRTTLPTSHSWPSPMPNPASMRAECPASHSSNKDESVNSDPGGSGWPWTDTAPGVYCAPDNKTIVIGGPGLTLVGYSFIAGDITLNKAGDSFGCTDATPCSSSAPRTVFFGTTGNVTLTQAVGAWDGEIYAPGDTANNGSVTGGKVTFSGGASATFDGLIESQTIQVNAKQTIFSGTGALVGGREPASLDE
jgi:hypothetical protein